MQSLPRTFIWRRLHSLMGFFIVLFLIEHLITNSQAALLVGQSGEGFIRAVNFIKNLPYLPVLEITLIGVPIAYHAILGIRYAITGKHNALSSAGNAPSLSSYGRNHAYTWQRITSWILLVGIAAHVVHMRFYTYPVSVDEGSRTNYFVRLTMDPGLYTVADRLGVTLYDRQAIACEREAFAKKEEQLCLFKEELANLEEGAYNRERAEIAERLQTLEFEQKWLEGLERRPITPNEVIAETSDFGTAVLLNVRNSFKSSINCALYSLFVASAVFHAFNGLWTFMITWGLIVRMRSQKQAVNICIGLMLIIGFLGLASVWGTYWVNLRS